MRRTVINASVDTSLLDAVRQGHRDRTDAELLEAGLSALLPTLPVELLEQRYAAAYSAHPIDEPDAWGDLESFRRAAAST